MAGLAQALKYEVGSVAPWPPDTFATCISTIGAHIATKSTGLKHPFATPAWPCKFKRFAGAWRSAVTPAQYPGGPGSNPVCPLPMRATPAQHGQGSKFNPQRAHSGFNPQCVNLAMRTTSASITMERISHTHMSPHHTVYVCHQPPLGIEPRTFSLQD